MALLHADFCIMKKLLAILLLSAFSFQPSGFSETLLYTLKASGTSAPREKTVDLTPGTFLSVSGSGTLQVQSSTAFISALIATGTNNGVVFTGSSIAGVASSTSTAGVTFMATDAEVQTGTNTLKTVAPSALAAWWTWVKTQAQTIAGNWTFSGTSTFSRAAVTGTATLNVVTSTNSTIATLTVNDSNPTAPNLSTLSGATTMANRQAGDARWAREKITFMPSQLLNTETYNPVTTVGIALGNPYVDTPALIFADNVTRNVVLPIPPSWTGTARAVHVLLQRGSGTANTPNVVLNFSEFRPNFGTSGTASPNGSVPLNVTSTTAFPSGTSGSYVWFSTTWNGSAFSNNLAPRCLRITRLGSDAGDTLDAALYVPFVVLERLDY